MSTVIEFDNVSFAYQSDTVLENVSFSVPKGDYASVVGPNGGGKTTLLRLALGLLQPQGGTVRLFGEQPHKTRFRVGYTPQFIHVDFQFPVSVLDIVLMGRLSRWRLCFSKEDREAAFNALETLKIADLAMQPFRALSGGQRQRALIARALCSEPELLLLDEPTNNIDPCSEQLLFKILDELNKKMTIILVSHDIGFVSQWVKSVICVNRTIALHPTSQLSGEQIRELYGGHIEMIRHDHRCSESGHKISF